MARDGVPLPSALSGNIVERLIRIDEALLYLINGALVELVDDWQLEQTGTLTVDDARSALAAMLYCYLGECDVTPIGALNLWPIATPPTKWLICDGQSLLRSAYAKLFAIIGTTYGAVDGTHFNVPDMRNKSPFGVGSALTPIGTNGGALNKSLSVNELAVHAHGVNDGGHSHVERTGSVQAHAATGGAGFVTFGTATSSNAALQSTDTALSNFTINNTGLGTAFSLLHPVMALNFIIYAGE